MSLINMSRTKNILAEMELAPFRFYLSGSRFFGFEKPGSDWDFFVEDHLDLENWLTNNGFTQESFCPYVSTEILRIWNHGPQQIHVQVVKNARLKSAVQESLYNSVERYSLYNFSKEDRKVLWNIAITLFQAGESQATPAASPTTVA